MSETLKDRELQAYYEALFAMFATPGWKYFVEDFANSEKLQDSVDGLESERQLAFRQGELSVVRQIIHQHEIVDHAYNELLARQLGEQDQPRAPGVAKVVDVVDPFA